MIAVRPLQRAASATLVLAFVGCGSATTGTVGRPASAKWVGPTIPSPDGGQVRTTIYYGPWQCSVAFMSRCETKCAAQGHALRGCIWLADFKGDWQGRFMLMPAAAGGRLAITHCCCDYPKVTDLQLRRDKWDNTRERFRNAWGSEFGTWPASKGKSWPGHHIFDLAHGGPPVAPDNVLPVPGDVHKVFNDEYPACYAPGGKWLTPGPEHPYVD
ncbi:hypothetical protein [Corallococcus llansteffanensis]|uniref:HNH endonuclease n=1 Tax=Corallococcus llansteffanensis TaxID=2316731 RepID=A0A3A8QJ93_9BACT|nr:hypothetical protein [Corallococcus llansteffanensis]RKH68763.1 hypothetical protein D7V93_00800 [Corallococcus llansteffanensis]